MALLTTQVTKTNGIESLITWVAASVAGDTFVNTGNESVFIRWGVGAGNVQVNGEPDAYGRDGTSVLTAAADGNVTTAGPFKLPNWSNSSGQVSITYPSGITGIEIAIVRQNRG